MIQKEHKVRERKTCFPLAQMFFSAVGYIYRYKTSIQSFRRLPSISPTYVLWGSTFRSHVSNQSILLFYLRHPLVTLGGRCSCDHPLMASPVFSVRTTWLRNTWLQRLLRRNECGFYRQVGFMLAKGLRSYFLGVRYYTSAPLPSYISHILFRR